MYKLIIILLLFLLSAFTYEYVNTHNYYWREYAFRTIPYDAVEIANDEKYIGQVYVNGGLVPATIYPYLGYAVAELFGKQIVKDHIKILCCPDHSKLYWDYVDFPKSAADGQMKNSILGGFYKDSNYDFNHFIGKLLHQGEWKVGKVIPIEHSRGALVIWNSTDGTPAHFKQFYMLKYNLTIDSPGGDINTCGKP